MRDRLIGLIQEAFMQPKYEIYIGGRNCAKGYVSAETIADYLLENGVIIPPCKVGDTIFEVVNNERIVTHSFRQQWRIARYLEEGIFGVYAFLTKEEAEARLEELKGGKK